MLFEVLSRYSFASPTSWAPELATLLFGPFFLLGGPYLLHTGGHVSVDVLSSAIKGSSQKLLRVVAIVLAVAFGAILFWYSYPLAIDSFHYRETSYTSWNPQIWPAKLALPLAMFFLVLQATAEFVFLFVDEAEMK